LQVQASFSNDLQTKEAPFQGSLLFCQNTEPFMSKAEKQRVISLHFLADQLTDTSRAAYEKIMTTDKREVAGIIQQTLINRAHFSGWDKEYQKAMTDLAPMSEQRILQNHALVLAFHRLFCSCFHISHDDATVTGFIRETCRKKCETSATRTTSIADHFFELLDTVETDKLSAVYHADPNKNEIYINLPRAENLIRNKGINFNFNETFSQSLQRHPAYIKNSYRYRFPSDPEFDERGLPRQRRAWVFSLEWFKNEAERQ
jgi:hypothetical protein